MRVRGYTRPHRTRDSESIALGARYGHTVRALALILLTSTALTGCGGHLLQIAAASAGPTASVTPTTTTPVEQPFHNSGVAFTDDPSIVNPHPVLVNSWSRLDDDEAVRLYVTVGSPDCVGVHATVTEAPDAVTVEVRTGTRPEAVGRMCTMIAMVGTLDVRLQSPLGDRLVLNVY
jgi:hypothetical protein